MEIAASLALFSFSHYGFLILFTLFAYCIGRRLTPGVTYHSRAEQFSFCAGLGLGVIASLVFAIGILRLLTPAIVLGTFGIVGVLVLPRRQEVKALGEWLRSVPKRHWVLCLAIVLILSSVFLLPLYPPTQPDAVGYHLALAKIYATGHAVEPATYLRYPVFTQLNEMLFTVMLLFQDDIAAQLVQFLMMWVVAIALYAWGRRAFNARAGLCGAVLWLSNPLVLWLGSSGYVDIGLAMFLVLAFYALLNWRQSHSRSWLLLSAVLFGFAAQSKYLALFPILLSGLFLLYAAVRERRARELVIFTAVVVVVGSPWYIYNAYYTGNPIWPYWASQLGYGPWTAVDAKDQFDQQLKHGAGKGTAALLLLPWNLSYRTSVFGAEFLLSPVYLFLLPLCLFAAIRDSYLRVLLMIAGLYTLFWFGTVQVLRYLVPAIPFLSLAAGAAVEKYVFRFPWTRSPAAAAVLTGCVCVLLAYPGYGRARIPGYDGVPLLKRPLPPVTPENRAAYLRDRLPFFAPIELLNRTRGSDYTVYNFFGSNLAYFVDGRYMGDFFGPARYSSLMDRFDQPKEFYLHLRSLGADYFLASANHSDGFGDFLADRVLAPDFRSRYFRLVYADSPVLLFEIKEQLVAAEEGPNLLKNSSFEELSDGYPADWSVVESPLIDNSGAGSHEGATTIRSDDRSWLQQRVAVESNRVYLLRHFSRAVKADQWARLQVHFFDREGSQVSAKWEVAIAGLGWHGHAMMVTAPAAAVWADVYASAHGPSEVWLDDFTFAAVQ